MLLYMRFTENRLQRIFILLPIMSIFFISIMNALSAAKLTKYIFIVSVLFIIQIITHIYLFFSGKTCLPVSNKVCNGFAFVIGVIYVLILTQCLHVKRTIFTWVAFCIAMYMVISHIYQLYPIKWVQAFFRKGKSSLKRYDNQAI